MIPISHGFFKRWQINRWRRTSLRHRPSRNVLDGCFPADCWSYIEWCVRSWMRSCCGFQKRGAYHFSLSFIFPLLWYSSIVSSDVGYFFVDQFHYIDVPRWSVLRISSCSQLNSLCSFLPVESIFHCLWLCWSNFYWYGSVSSSICLRTSLMSSSHLFLDLPIDLLVLYFELSSGFHSAALINRLSFSDVAILIASLHSIFLWVIFQHLIFSFSIFSIASMVLLLM